MRTVSGGRLFGALWTLPLITLHKILQTLQNPKTSSSLDSPKVPRQRCKDREIAADVPVRGPSLSEAQGAGLTGVGFLGFRFYRVIGFMRFIGFIGLMGL